MRQNRIGPVQWQYLQNLADLRDGSGIWFPGCGWGGDSASRDVVVFEALVRRGFAERTEADRPEFRITPEGREYRERQRMQPIRPRN